MLAVIFFSKLYFENGLNQINNNTEMIKSDVIIPMNVNDSKKNFTVDEISEKIFRFE